MLSGCLVVTLQCEIELQVRVLGLVVNLAKHVWALAGYRGHSAQGPDTGTNQHVTVNYRKRQVLQNINIKTSRIYPIMVTLKPK